MPSIAFSGKEYPVSERADPFLKSYVLRVRRYVETNGLGDEYAKDIEDRIAEKLASLGAEASETDAIKIVNELGEPEDIFLGVPKKERGTFDSVAGSVRSNLKSPLYRDSSKGIIFWVCAGLGDKFDVDPFFIRLLFVFLFFFYGTGVFAYLVLALLMKDKAKIENTERDIESKVNDGIATTISALRSVPDSTVRIVSGTVGTLVRIFGFLFFGFLAFWLALFSLGFFAAFGVAASGLVIDNQSLFAGMHPSLVYASCAAGVAFFTLAWMSVFKAFGKSAGGGAVLAGAGLVLAASLAAGAFGTFRTVANFSHRETVENKIETSVSAGEISLDFKTVSRSREGFEIPKWTEIRFEKTDGKTLEFSAITEISAADKLSAEAVASKTVPLSVTGTGNSLSVSGIDAAFVGTVPYSFPKRTLVVKVPETVDIRIAKASRDVRIDGIRYSQLDSFVSSSNCEKTVVKYDAAEGSFICDLSGYDEGTVNAAKIAFLESNSRDFMPEARPESVSEEAEPYAYDDEVRFRSLSGGLFEGKFVLRYPHPSTVADSVTKTFRVNVGSHGEMRAEEVVSK